MNLARCASKRTKNRHLLGRLEDCRKVVRCPFALELNCSNSVPRLFQKMSLHLILWPIFVEEIKSAKKYHMWHWDDPSGGKRSPKSKRCQNIVFWIPEKINNFFNELKWVKTRSKHHFWFTFYGIRSSFGPFVKNLFLSQNGHLWKVKT